MIARMGSNMFEYEQSTGRTGIGLSNDDKQHLVQATQWWADGLELQLLGYGGVWLDRAEGNKHLPPYPGTTYRPKPKPTLVPWTGETFPSDRVVIVYKKGNTGRGSVILSWGGGGVLFIRSNEMAVCPYAELLDLYEQTNGEPCGTVEQ